MYIVIDQFDPSMPIEFRECEKHGTRLHFDGNCPGCMEEKYGSLDGVDQPTVGDN